jgi:hypothetical protein
MRHEALGTRVARTERALVREWFDALPPWERVNVAALADMGIVRTPGPAACEDAARLACGDWRALLAAWVPDPDAQKAFGEKCRAALAAGDFTGAAGALVEVCLSALRRTLAAVPAAFVLANTHERLASCRDTAVPRLAEQLAARRSVEGSA